MIHFVESRKGPGPFGAGFRHIRQEELSTKWRSRSNRHLVGSGVLHGATALVVHARKALLEGLSPKDNRSIPPLDYELVHALKRAHADWPIVLNGGLADLDAARAQLSHVDGIMLGRAAYQNPELLIGVDPGLFGELSLVADGFEAIEAFMAVIARGLQRGERLHDYTRHLHGVFTGRPGARAYRQVLATEAVKRGAGLDVLRDAISRVEREQRFVAAAE